MIFTMSLGTRSPVPQACDIMRLICNWANWSASMLMSHNEPKPVVTP